MLDEAIKEILEDLDMEPTTSFSHLSTLDKRNLLREWRSYVEEIEEVTLSEYLTMVLDKET